MTTAIKGKSVAEAEELFERFHALLTGQQVDEKSVGKLAAFKGIAEYPMRVKCATLAWHALMDAMGKK